MSQPRCAPCSRYSRILFLSALSRSLCDFTSITKSEQRCQNDSLPPSPSSRTRLFSVQETSGETRAPLGSTKPVEESQTMPLRSFLARVAEFASDLKVGGASIGMG